MPFVFFRVIKHNRIFLSPENNDFLPHQNRSGGVARIAVFDYERRRDDRENVGGQVFAKLNVTHVFIGI